MYQVLDEMRIRRVSDEAIIPVNTDNTDYQRYLEWLEGGGVPQPAEPTGPHVPQSASRYQARAALLEAGLLNDVEDHFAALPDSSLMKLAWKEAPTVLRTSDAVSSAAAALGITGEQLDALFIRANEFV